MFEKPKIQEIFEEQPKVDPEHIIEGRLSENEMLDDNGKKFRVDDGAWIPNNVYELDGINYKTDDFGNVYQENGKCYPSDFFVLDGIIYFTDENGMVILDEIPPSSSGKIESKPLFDENNPFEDMGKPSIFESHKDEELYLYGFENAEGTIDWFTADGVFWDSENMTNNHLLEDSGIRLKDLPYPNIPDSTWPPLTEQGVSDGISSLTDSQNTENTEEEVDTTDSDEQSEQGKKGGSYKDVRVDGEGDKYEVHHMPADSASNLERGDGPAIKMEKEDHRQTASCGMSREAREYREKQKELIEQGKFREALQMDIDDIHEKFGDKYDDAIKEMLEYVDQLEEEGKI